MDSLPQWQRPGPPTCVPGSEKWNCWDHSITFKRKTQQRASGCKALITPCRLRHGILVLPCCNIALISSKDSITFLRHQTAVHLGQGPGWHNSGHLCGPFGREGNLREIPRFRPISMHSFSPIGHAVWSVSKGCELRRLHSYQWIWCSTLKTSKLQKTIDYLDILLKLPSTM